MQGLLDAVWTHLLPALTADVEVSSAAAPGAPRSLPGPAAGPPPDGIGPMTFGPGPGNELPELHTVRLTATEGGVDPTEIRLVDAGPELVAALGPPGGWTRTGPVAAAAGWTEGRLHVDLIFVETPHRLHLRLDPEQGRFAARWQTTPFANPVLADLRMPR
jgi:hypothetical protein